MPWCVREGAGGERRRRAQTKETARRVLGLSPPPQKKKGPVDPLLLPRVRFRRLLDAIILNIFFRGGQSAGCVGPDGTGGLEETPRGLCSPGGCGGG